MTLSTESDFTRLAHALSHGGLTASVELGGGWHVVIKSAVTPEVFFTVGTLNGHLELQPNYVDGTPYDGELFPLGDLPMPKLVARIRSIVLDTPSESVPIASHLFLALRVKREEKNAWVRAAKDSVYRKLQPWAIAALNDAVRKGGG